MHMHVRANTHTHKQSFHKAPKKQIHLRSYESPAEEVALEALERVELHSPLISVIYRSRFDNQEAGQRVVRRVGLRGERGSGAAYTT